MLTPAGSHSKTESKRRSLKPQSSAQPVGTTMVSRIWWEVQMAGSRDEACAPGRLLCLYYNGGQKNLSVYLLGLQLDPFLPAAAGT